MNKHEAMQLIQSWIQEHSPFIAEVVNATARDDGVWEVTVECSEMIWIQTISLVGEVGNPVWMN
jgi:hypothetical protein